MTIMRDKDLMELMAYRRTGLTPAQVTARQAAEEDEAPLPLIRGQEVPRAYEDDA